MEAGHALLSKLHRSLLPTKTTADASHPAINSRPDDGALARPYPLAPPEPPAATHGLVSPYWLAAPDLPAHPATLSESTPTLSNMSGATRPRWGTLAERSSGSPREERQPSTSTVAIDGQTPALLRLWRRSDSGWEGHVTFIASGRFVTTWLPANRITPS